MWLIQPWFQPDPGPKFALVLTIVYSDIFSMAVKL